MYLGGLRNLLVTFAKLCAVRDTAENLSPAMLASVCPRTVYGCGLVLPACLYENGHKKADQPLRDSSSCVAEDCVTT